MRILCAIVEPTAALVPLGSDTDLVHRRRICPKAIGDDAARSPVFLHDPLEKLQRRGFVPPRGDHSLQDLALMVDCAPQIAELAVNLHKCLIQVPAPLRIAAHVRDASLANLGSEHRAKRFHHNRTVSWLMSIPRSAHRASTWRSDSGYRTYIITTRRMTSRELLKYRNGLLMRRGKHTRDSRRICSNT